MHINILYSLYDLLRIYANLKTVKSFFFFVFDYKIRDFDSYPKILVNKLGHCRNFEIWLEDTENIPDELLLILPPYIDRDYESYINKFLHSQGCYKNKANLDESIKTLYRICFNATTDMTEQFPNSGALFKRLLIQSLYGKPSFDSYDLAPPFPFSDKHKIENFMFREKDLDELEMLMLKNRHLIISGSVGVGKTYLVKEFINRHLFSKHSNCKLSDYYIANYQNSLKSSIADMDFFNYDYTEENLCSSQKFYEKNLMILKEKGDTSLLVIDNMNADIEEFNDYLTILSELPIRIIITTSCNIEKSSSLFPVYTLSPFSIDILKEIFTHYCSRTYDDNDINKLIGQLDYNTQATVVFAKTCNKSCVPLSQLLNDASRAHNLTFKELGKNNSFRTSYDKTSPDYVNKENKTSQRGLQQHLSNLLFYKRCVSSKELDCLTYLSIFSYIETEIQAALKWIPQLNLEIIQALHFKGWITYSAENKTIQMPRLITECIMSAQKISFSKVAPVLKNIQTFLHNFKITSPEDPNVLILNFKYVVQVLYEIFFNLHQNYSQTDFSDWLDFFIDLVTYYLDNFDTIRSEVILLQFEKDCQPLSTDLSQVFKMLRIRIQAIEGDVVELLNHAQSPIFLSNKREFLLFWNNLKTLAYIYHTCYKKDFSIPINLDDLPSKKESWDIFYNCLSTFNLLDGFNKLEFSYYRCLCSIGNDWNEINNLYAIAKLCPANSILQLSILSDFISYIILFLIRSNKLYLEIDYIDRLASIINSTLSKRTDIPPQILQSALCADLFYYAFYKKQPITGFNKLKLFTDPNYESANIINKEDPKELEKVLDEIIEELPQRFPNWSDINLDINP